MSATRQRRAVADTDEAGNECGARGDFARDLVAGLAQTPKRIPSKYLYDSEGSRLFDRICDLPEYYPTRTEIGLMRRYAGEMAQLIGPDAELVEFGAGSTLKARLLLDAMARPRAYLPIDISGDYLRAEAARLEAEYPGLGVRPVAADFSRPLILPQPSPGTRCRAGFFPGSTIGNFTPDEARHFLARAARVLTGGGLLVGVDLIKEPAVLHAAYNDRSGMTAAFNKNLLARANRELGGDFDLARFDHYAHFEPANRRVSMWLVSAARQCASVAGHEFAFAAGEGIHTEYSYKYTVEGFRSLAAEAGLAPRAAWSDPARLFSIHWLAA